MSKSCSPMPVPSAVMMVLYLGVGQHLVEASLFHVEHLAAQRQHRLVLAGRVPASPSRRPSRPRRGKAPLRSGERSLAVGKLARQGSAIECSLAACQVARLARRLARAGGFGCLSG